MKARAATKPILPAPSSEKLEMIRSGKRRKSITGFKEAKNITFSNKEGKFVAVEKEKKFEEAGVTKKKRNFIMFESKLGTERERDLHKIGNAINAQAKERILEKIITKKKKKEYLDNYQYHETKNLKFAQPDTVVHTRWGGPVGGTYEEVTKERVISKRGGSAEPKRGPVKPPKPAQALKNRPQSSSGTKTQESTTKVGRRGGNGGKTSTTTTTKKETRTTTTKGGQTKTSTKTTTTRRKK